MEYVGLKEIAKILGVTTARTFQIVSDYKDFPKPKAKLAMGRVWSLKEVNAWIGKHPVRKVGRPKKTV